MLGLPAATALAGPAAPDGQWHFAVTPYIWLPTIHSKFDFSLPPDEGGTIENELGPKNLNFALLLNGEARLDDWAITADFIYLDLSSTGSRVTEVGRGGDTVLIPRDRNLGTQTDLKAYVATLAGSYTVLRREAATMDVLAGVRVLHPQVGMDWSLDSNVDGTDFTLQRSGHVDGDLTLVDGIVGLRGRAWFGDQGKWFVSYYGDVGAGNSALTWQAFAALGYTLSWGEALVGYRYLSYDQSDEKFVQDMSFKGPLVGVSFRF
jgi:hypothetical protein